MTGLDIHLIQILCDIKKSEWSVMKSKSDSFVIAQLIAIREIFDWACKYGIKEKN